MKYETPDIEAVYMDPEDVIMTSSLENGNDILDANIDEVDISGSMD